MKSGDQTVGDPGAAVSSRVLAAVAPEHWGPSFFGVVPEGSVRRRPSELVQLILAVALIVACILVTDGFTARADDTYRWVTDLPTWIGTFGTSLFVACTVGAVVVVIGALLLTRNVRLALTLVIIGVLTVILSYALASVVDVDAVVEAADQEVGSLSAESVVWLAVSTAVLLSAAPYLVRPARRTVYLVQLLALFGCAIAGIGTLATVLGAVGVGWAIAAVVGLVVGTPAATPTTRSVLRALGELGVAIGELALGDNRTWGETRFIGRTSDGRRASVVVIGRDGADARLLNKVWRSIVYRDAGPSISISRSAQLEHRAYMHLMAAKAGVPVSEVVIAATAGRDDTALLALVDPDGVVLSELASDQITDDMLDSGWTSLAMLHDARLTHGKIGPENVVVRPDGSVALLDFERGSAGGPPERVVRDQVDLLVSTAGVVGDDRALAAAIRAIGREGMVELLPMVTNAAISPGARRAIDDPRKRLKQLRDGAAEFSGTEVPKLTELRRVSPSSLAMAAATFVGFYLIVAQFTGVDLVATLSDAEWAWVFVAALFSFGPQFSGSVALMGTVSRPLPFGPVLAEQFANNFTGLIGGTVANTALVIRFFQKQGLKVAVAASSGVLNSLAGGVIQVVLVTVGLVLSDTQYVSGSVGGGGIERLILVGIVVLGLAVTIALLIPKLRAAVRRTVAPQMDAARDNLRMILKTPRKAVMIFGGNLCSQLAYALVIDAALRAYGAELPLADIVVINSLASLLGGLAPVPGGMGVIEAGLIGGMTAAGVPQSEAVAATFTARLFTTYLSPIWGWAALQWLRRRDYV
jgi:uncharacterized membrane protein YbhN (UPF0104 family)/tRNA A-37 threonylcarbamoyl transferase component Bud32